MFLLIGTIFIWAMMLIYRLMDMILRIILIPAEILLWTFRFLLF